MGVSGGRSVPVSYPKPSLKTALGLAAAKKKVKRDRGIYKITGIFNAPGNAKRRARRAVGWESEGARLVRLIARLFK
jgi:hypothetical protein